MRTLTIPMPEGSCEALLALPPGERGPGVVFFMDAFGIRPRIEVMAREIASWGFVVLVPNLFYRDGTIEELRPDVDMLSPEGREAAWTSVAPRVGHLTTRRMQSDVVNYLAALRGSRYVTGRKVGAVGFCMGARAATYAAGLTPDVAACAGFHGGGLVTSDADSPHRVLATATAEFVYGHADNDRSMTPERVAELGAALTAAGLTATNEVYPDAPHGYTMSDTDAWNEPGYQRAFGALRDLLERTIR